MNVSHLERCYAIHAMLAMPSARGFQLHILRTSIVLPHTYTYTLTQYLLFTHTLTHMYFLLPILFPIPYSFISLFYFSSLFLFHSLFFFLLRSSALPLPISSTSLTSLTGKFHSLPLLLSFLLSRQFSPKLSPSSHIHITPHSLSDSHHIVFPHKFPSHQYFFLNDHTIVLVVKCLFSYVNLSLLPSSSRRKNLVFLSLSLTSFEYTIPLPITYFLRCSFLTPLSSTSCHPYLFISCYNKQTHFLPSIPHLTLSLLSLQQQMSSDTPASFQFPNPSFSLRHPSRETLPPAAEIKEMTEGF